MKREWRWKRDILSEFSDDLRGSDDVALLGLERGKSLRELRVAVALANVGRGEKLLCRGEFGGKLGAIAAVGAPGFDNGQAGNGGNEESPEFEHGR